MPDPLENYHKLIQILDANKVEYKLFEHQAALTYEDLAQVQKETGFFGTEGKCMVLKVDGTFMVYITIQGRRVNLEAIKSYLGAKKIRLATAEELKEHFGAEPGCAYPFGFDASVNIYIDPVVYSQNWFLFSPVLSTRTVQAKGADLKKVFSSLPNQVTETPDFNTT